MFHVVRERNVSSHCFETSLSFTRKHRKEGGRERRKEGRRR
jgi:hypothetical protein